MKVTNTTDFDTNIQLHSLLLRLVDIW